MLDLEYRIMTMDNGLKNLMSRVSDLERKVEDITESERKFYDVESTMNKNEKNILDTAVTFDKENIEKFDNNIDSLRDRIKRLEDFIKLFELTYDDLDNVDMGSVNVFNNIDIDFNDTIRVIKFKIRNRKR